MFIIFFSVENDCRKKAEADLQILVKVVPDWPDNTAATFAWHGSRHIAFVSSLLNELWAGRQAMEGRPISAFSEFTMCSQV